MLTLNGIFRPCFYNELFQSDKLILIFVLLKNFGQIFNFLSCGTKSYRRIWSIQKISPLYIYIYISPFTEIIFYQNAFSL